MTSELDDFPFMAFHKTCTSEHHDFLHRCRMKTDVCGNLENILLYLMTLQHMVEFKKLELS